LSILLQKALSNLTILVILGRAFFLACVSWAFGFGFNAFY